MIWSFRIILELILQSIIDPIIIQYSIIIQL